MQVSHQTQNVVIFVFEILLIFGLMSRCEDAPNNGRPSGPSPASQIQKQIFLPANCNTKRSVRDATQPYTRTRLGCAHMVSCAPSARQTRAKAAHVCITSVSLTSGKRSGITGGVPASSPKARPERSTSAVQNEMLNACYTSGRNVEMLEFNYLWLARGRRRKSWVVRLRVENLSRSTRRTGAPWACWPACFAWTARAPP